MNSKERSPSTHKRHATWDEVEGWMWDIVSFLNKLDQKFKFIYGIPRGGLFPAVWLSHYMNLKFLLRTDDYPGTSWNNILIVEDVIDTGKSIRGFQKFYSHMPIISLVRKPWSPKILFAAKETEDWVQFPWENK